MSNPAFPPPFRSSTRLRRAGFTIVEILAVIGTITVLLGLLLAGLQAARNSGQTTVALNQLRQLHMASTAYTGSNADRYMPGYLDDEGQSQWRVRYKYESGGQIAPRLARTYPWRILPYLDWSYQTMLGYVTEDQEWIDRVPRKGDVNTISPEAIDIADVPWFGYNAYYVGGWWETEPGERTRMRFANAEWEQTPTTSGGAPIVTKGRLVVQSEGRAVDPTRLILFGGATRRDPGIYTPENGYEAGAAWICPPVLADTVVWETFLGVARRPAGGAGPLFAQATMFDVPETPRFFAQGADAKIRVNVAQSIPYRRVASQVWICHLDGSTAGEGINQLIDMRRWVNAANDAVGNPIEFRHSPD